MTKTLRCSIIFTLLFSSLQTFSQQRPDTLKLGPGFVFSKVEIEASFPGGDAAWAKYVYNEMSNADFTKFRNSDQGTCRVRFIVDTKGNVTNVEAITMKKSRLAKLAVQIIENGPRWNPAQQDGRKVNAYREQPISFQFAKEEKR